MHPSERTYVDRIDDHEPRLNLGRKLVIISASPNPACDAAHGGMRRWYPSQNVDPGYCGFVKTLKESVLR